ncbi:FkbM family methyltransferase [Pedobacter sp. Leaf216]|uniref:FkbM family methyltransferase n=1 Tax=Pedobacter sp. Leaf216 TaxID=1735684 RepID=UPI0009EC2333|nr:FkbM family methyltransferase [Pedobacter sp. Leaf216]
MELKELMLNYLVRIIPRFIKRRIITQSENSGILTFSQEGEDRLIERIIGKKHYGIYVDVGAHHPSSLSNTYYFYRMGWRGINIDAMPGSMAQFNKTRPYDINIEQPISDEVANLDYYMFSSPELNTFDTKNVAVFLTYPTVKLLDKISLKTTRLATVLEQNLSKLGANEIDFLSIDVEGLDLKVLRSNDWLKFRPNLILVEDLFADVMKSYNSELSTYLNNVGYNMVAKTQNTIFFKKIA